MTRTHPEFVPGPPRLLFAGNYMNVPGHSYDVTPDGRRFVLVKPADDQPTRTQINVVLNWFEELKQRVPASKDKASVDKRYLGR